MGPGASFATKGSRSQACLKLNAKHESRLSPVLPTNWLERKVARTLFSGLIHLLERLTKLRETASLNVTDLF